MRGCIMRAGVMRAGMMSGGGFFLHLMNGIESIDVYGRDGRGCRQGGGVEVGVVGVGVAHHMESCCANGGHVDGHRTGVVGEER